MASLYIAFLSAGSARFGGVLPVADGETAISETVTTSASNTQSSATTQSYARVVSNVAHWIAIGANPDATVATARYYLPANTIEYFQIEIGNKVAGATA